MKTVGIIGLKMTEQNKLQEENRFKKLEVLFLIALYLSMLYLWTLPFQQQKIPYGESDATIHFFLADRIYLTDKPLTQVPPINSVLGLDVEVKQGFLAYAPQFYTGLAITEVIGGDRVVPFYLYLAITCSVIFFSLYFLLRKLFGSTTAMLANFFIIFSMRERFTYLWGQWATAISFAFIPLILYAFYEYTNSFLEKKDKKEERPLYLYIIFVLFAIQFLFHPIGFLLCFGMIMVYFILIMVKERKIPINMKHVFFALCLFFIIIFTFAPLQTRSNFRRVLYNVGLYEYENPEMQFGNVSLKKDINYTRFSRIFKWYDFPQEIAGSYPAFIFSYKDIYYGYWTLPFLFLGIAFLAIRRKRKDLLMLSMIIALYLLLHTDVVGVYLESKIIRLFYAESIIFYSLIAIGITSIPSFIKMDEKSRGTIKYVLVILAAILILSIGAKATYNQFKSAYGGIQRLNSAQFEAANWINDNLPQDAGVMYVGTPTFLHRAWLQAVSARLGIFDQFNVIPINDPNINRTNYVLMDYSWYQMLGDQQSIAQLQEWEKGNVKGDLIYDQNGVKIYKVA